MVVRNCAGGIVFCGTKVFIMKNEKGEWVFPKGVIRHGDIPNEVATRRVKEEADIASEIVATAGNSNYEFFSVTRQKPVCNKITWYIMRSNNNYFKIKEMEKYSEGGYYDVEEAIKMVTYSQDKALLNLSYKEFQKVMSTPG